MLPADIVDFSFKSADEKPLQSAVNLLRFGHFRCSSSLVGEDIDTLAREFSL